MSKANSSRIKEAAQRRYIVQISHDRRYLAHPLHRVLDDASRQRRARKALENLEQVRNVVSSCSFLSSHLPLVLDRHMCQLLHYAGQQLRRPTRRPGYEQEGPESFPGGRGAWPEEDKEKSNCLSHSIPQDSSILIFDFHQARTMEYYKQRFRKNLAQLLEEEAGEQEGEVIGVSSERLQPQLS